MCKRSRFWKTAFRKPTGSPNAKPYTPLEAASAGGMLPAMNTPSSLTLKSSAMASLLTAAVISIGCGDSSPSAPTSVPSGDTAAIGTDGAAVSKAQFNRFLEAQIGGTSPIGGSIGGSIPLDPPAFTRCKAALAANARKNKQPQPTGTQLAAGCKSQYAQTRAAVQSQLISYQWLLQAAKEAGVKVDPKEIDQTLSQYITASAGAKASAKAAFDQRLAKSGMTKDDVRLQLEAQIAQQKLSTKDQEEAEEPRPTRPRPSTRRTRACSSRPTASRRRPLPGSRSRSSRS